VHIFVPLVNDPYLKLPMSKCNYLYIRSHTCPVHVWFSWRGREGPVPMVNLVTTFLSCYYPTAASTVPILAGLLVGEAGEVRRSCSNWLLQHFCAAIGQLQYQLFLYLVGGAEKVEKVLFLVVNYNSFGLLLAN